LRSLCSHTISLTSGRPIVIVPVLSTTTASIFLAFSKVSAFLINIPDSAPLPIPTISAVGVARPKAHGQAIINTVTRVTKACVTFGSGPTKNHNNELIIEMLITTGTKIDAILSAILWAGALLPCAFLTISIICDNIVF